MIDFTDKNGNSVLEDDVLFDGTYHHRIYTSPKGRAEMICCNLGYTHDVTQELVGTWERIGNYIGNEHLFECD